MVDIRELRKVEKLQNINMEGGRVGQRNEPGLLNNMKSWPEVEGHELIEVAIYFIVYFL